MRILFVPMAGPGHIIALLALRRLCLEEDPSTETAFLQPVLRHVALRRMGVDVLDIDHRSVIRTEVEAYRRFKPDVVIDDNSFTTGYACRAMQMPRVTVLRMGLFAGYVPRSSAQRHSLPPLPDAPPDLEGLGLTPYRTLAEFFQASRSIVPATLLIEPPVGGVADETHEYCGPLMLPDPLVERLLMPGRDTAEQLRTFCARHRDRRRVLVTLGTVVTATPQLQEAIRALLDAGVCVVSSVEVPNLSVRQMYSFFYAPILPMHQACEAVDLVVHQCGSGTYHYPLLHARPSVTIGSACYDRDDISLRLQELGVSRHVADPTSEGVVRELPQLISDILDYPTRVNACAVQLAAIRAEIDRTSAEFSVLRVAERAIRQQDLVA